MAQQDPWAWANQPQQQIVAPLAASIQPSQEQPGAASQKQQDPMLSMAENGMINSAPAMWDAGKAAYIKAQSVPLAAEAIPSIGATNTMGALSSAAPLAAAEGAATAATAIGGATTAGTAGLMSGMGAAAPAALAALGPAALIPLGIYGVSKLTKGK